MATTFVDYTGDGNATKAFSFPSYQESDVKVEVDGVLKTTSTHYNITSYTTTGGGNVVFTSGNIPASPATIHIFRDTDVDSAKSTYQAGSSVKAGDLNNNQTQILYAIDEEKTQLTKTSEIKNDAITGAKIADDAIDSEHYTDGSIDLAHMSANSVDSDQYVDGSIDHVHLANDVIDGDNIQDDVINSEHIAAGAVDLEHMSANSVDSDQYVDGSIDTAHIADLQVTTAKIAADAVTGAKIADDAINSEHYSTSSIDTAHIADSQITTAKIADANVTTAKLADSSVTSAKLAAGALTTADIADDAITGAKIADDAIDSEHIAADSIDAEHYAANSVDTTALAADAVTGAQIADDAIDSEHYIDGSIDLAHLASGSVDSTKLTAATVVTNSEQAAATADDASFFTTSASDARYFNISSGDTIKDGVTFPDNDTTIATTAAINDRIIDLVDDVGGFVPIANETSFPAANPDVNNGAGTLVSIKALASNLTSNGSGVATIANGAGTGNTVTINGLANSTTYNAGFGLIVETTTTLHTYSFHRQVPKATEVTTVAGSISNVNTVAGAISNVNTTASNISNVNTTAGSISNVNTTAGSISNVNSVASNIANVNNFADLYQIDDFSPSAPTTDGGGNSVAEGDLAYDSTANRLKVYTGSAWEDGVAAPSDLISRNTVDAKGDLITGSADNTVVRTAVGTNGKFLKADSGATGGVSWDTVTQTDTTYGISCVDGDNSDEEKIRLTAGGSGSGTDDIVLEAGTGLSIARTSDKITFTNTVSNTNTQLTEEEVEDFVGGMVTGNTETGITVTYEDSDGTLDFVVAPEGTSVVSSGESGGSKFLREDGDGTCSWQTVPAGGISDVVSDTTPQLGGNLDVNAKNITFGDSAGATDDRLTFGAGTDLSIYHDGTYNYIDSNGQSVTIRNSANNNDHIAHFIAGGAVELRHNGSKKFETTAAGVTVTGAVTATSFSGNGASLTNVAVNTVASDASGYENVYLGSNALEDQTDGERNVAVGHDAGKDITSGVDNVIIGHSAGIALTTGDNCIAIGRRGGWNLTNDHNIAIGNLAGGNGTTSVAIGSSSLTSHTGEGVVALGYQAGKLNTSGTYNTYIGHLAGNGSNDKTGNDNTAVGKAAGANLSDGTKNTCLGSKAGDAITTGDNNTLLGYEATASAVGVDNEVTIGNDNVTKFRVPGINFTVKDTTATEDYVLTLDANGEAGWEVAGGTVANGCIYENDQTISNNYTIAAGKGAHSVGPITVSATVTVNGNWVVS